MSRALKILLLCRQNAARSQMMAAYLKTLLPRCTIQSAGSQPAQQVDPLAVKVMAEEGIDISNEVPKSVVLFQQDTFDYVITVCKETEEYGTCPLFFGTTKERLNLEIEDPAQAHGSEQDRLTRYRSIRDTIKAFAIDFAHKISF